MAFIMICRWYSNGESAEYPFIGWINGAEDGPSSLFATMDEYLHSGVRMEILEVLGELDVHSGRDVTHMRTAVANHRKLLKEND